jgi:hypothetical protein
MQRERIHDAHTPVCANFACPLNQIDLFSGAVDTTVSPQNTATPAPTSAGAASPLNSVTDFKTAPTPTPSLYCVERLPDGKTRVTDHGRITFNGIIGGAKP